MQTTHTRSRDYELNVAQTRTLTPTHKHIYRPTEHVHNIPKHENAHTYTYVDVRTNDPLRIPHPSLGNGDPCQMRYKDRLCKQFELTDATFCVNPIRNTANNIGYSRPSRFSCYVSLTSAEAKIHPSTHAYED